LVKWLVTKKMVLVRSWHISAICGYCERTTGEHWLLKHHRENFLNLFTFPLDLI
jgi:hypothetical protein